ncbi:hypothetical protein [Streptomyces antibioticus]|uniref:hypothetical protein n=1 Tax=Streptomyces antibioticus TaxID=1890 RepID=UPI0033CFFD94
MSLNYPRFENGGLYEKPYIDLRNVPKSSVTVTVDIRDSKLADAVHEKIRLLKVSKSQALNAESWGVVHRVTLKIAVLEEVLKEAGI